MLETTKYLDLAEELESRIDSRTWKNRLPGVATLSKEFSVNTRTVTKALRVLSKKGKIEIRPSSGAYIYPNRRGRKYSTIGVLGQLHTNKAQAELMAIEQQAKTKDYHILNVEHSRQIFKSRPDVLLEIPVDGFIFTNSTLSNDMVVSLKHRGIPFVSINRISDVEGVNWVDFHHDNAHAKMLNHLLDLGHRRIAYVSFRAGIEEHGRRMRELYQNVLLPKKAYDPMLYIDDGDMHEYYQRFGENYIAEYTMERAPILMRMPTPPTAVICEGDQVLAGFVNHVRKMGFDIPSDLSVVGSCQNYQRAQQVDSITMISGSVCQKARRATELLMEIIDNPGREPVQEFIELDIIDRGSTGPCTS